MDFFLSLIQNTMLLNNFLLLAFFVGFAIVFFMESRNPNSQVNWTDAIVDKRTNRVSLNKLGQFFGISISSWVIIYLTQKPEAYAILPMMYPAYLAFIAGVYTFNTWLKSKQEKDDEGEME